jgi:hypothetical protein
MNTRLFGKELSVVEKEWVEALAKSLVHVWSATVPHDELKMIGAAMVSFLQHRGCGPDKIKTVLSDMLTELRNRSFMQKVEKIHD